MAISHVLLLVTEVKPYWPGLLLGWVTFSETSDVGFFPDRLFFDFIPVLLFLESIPRKWLSAILFLERTSVSQDVCVVNRHGRSEEVPNCVAPSVCGRKRGFRCRCRCISGPKIRMGRGGSHNCFNLNICKSHLREPQWNTHQPPSHSAIPIHMTPYPVVTSVFRNHKFTNPVQHPKSLLSSFSFNY